MDQKCTWWLLIEKCWCIECVVKVQVARLFFTVWASDIRTDRDELPISVTSSVLFSSSEVVLQPFKGKVKVYFPYETRLWIDLNVCAFSNIGLQVTTQSFIQTKESSRTFFFSIFTNPICSCLLDTLHGHPRWVPKPYLCWQRLFSQLIFQSWQLSEPSGIIKPNRPLH